MCEDSFSNGMPLPDPDWQAHQGEIVSIAETLAFAPISGRLRRRSLDVGTSVVQGTVLGELVTGNGDGTRAVTATEDGVFLGWLAWEGESVSRGSLLARLAPNLNGNGHPEPVRS